jgi:AraC-like DNA-binding protein
MNTLIKASFLEISSFQTVNQPGIRLSQSNFTIVWILSGRVKCQVDLHQFEIGDNQLACIKPGKFSRLQYNGRPEGYLISFSDTFLGLEGQEADISYHRSLFQLFAQAARISVQEDIKQEMLDIVSIMGKESGNSFVYRDQILRRYYKIFLIYLSRHCQEAHENLINSRGSEIVQEFMGLLERNYKLKRSVAEYAQAMSVTPNHLNVVVKKTTGKTAGYHIKHRLTLEAKRLIIGSSLCMKEIAYELGFSDTAHFSKFFKNFAGKNFSDFKRQNIGGLALA